MTQETKQLIVLAGPFRVGEWLVEPSLNRLSRDERTIQLELKVMDVLVCLAERAGEVVPRHEIVDTVWATEFIADNTLTHAITEIRNAFGDDARNPSFIETIHRRGYRLIASVEAVVSDEPGISKVARFPVPERAIEDDRNPYPGLAAFTEEDTEFFYGREAEVARLWRTLTARRLLAVIGPSGVGKSSFLHAGLTPAAPADWGTLVCEPGERPFGSLARALAPEFEGDPEAISELVDISDEAAAVAVISRWRHRHEQALLVVDQFEELFTLNPPEVQKTFAELLARLARDADVHVLLVLRDDFLYRCHDHDALMPIFSELTPVKVPAVDDLRRALVQPAEGFGYAFEDAGLADEMLEAVKDERGALPMLAFTVARLWEKRDTEKQELTQSAYRDIGGVTGALAQHAESTLTTIGQERLPVVREIFRNLVTAEGTRAVRDWDELLSIFRDSRSESPEEVLRALIDARLLTSFEFRKEDGQPIRRVEIIHESLLTNWPRLVRWQTQDQEGAQLRDELRQAARAWDEHDRSDDRLWAGSAYREFAVWRERYPGGLTDSEEAFENAMTVLAGRRRRRRRIAVATGFAILLAGLAIVGSFWQRSVHATRRAEAANLVSQAQLELASYPSAAVAYATASLEQSDSQEARRLALRALWKGPTAFVINEVPSLIVAFTPDGRWLVQSTFDPPHRLHVIGADGSDVLLKDVHDGWVGVRMDSESGVFATASVRHDLAEPIALWSAPEKTLLAKGHSGFPDRTFGRYDDLRRRRVLLLVLGDDQFFVDAMGYDGTSERLGTIPFDLRSATRCIDAPNGEWTAVSNGQNVYVVDFGDHDLSKPRRLDHIVGPVADIECDPLGRFVAVRYEDGKIRLWDLDGESPPRVIQGPLGIRSFKITPDGSLLEALKHENDEGEIWIWSLENEDPALLSHINLGMASGSSGWTLNPVEGQVVSVFNPDAKIRLWPFWSPGDAEPVVMQRGNTGSPRMVEIHPAGRWVASSFTNGLTLWPVATRYPTVIERYEERVSNLLFGPEGRWLVASSLNENGTVRLWQLEGNALPPARILHEAEAFAYNLAVTPDGEKILLGLFKGAQLLSLDGGPPRDLPGAKFGFTKGGVAISADGRFAAVTSGPDPYKNLVWDLASGEEVAVMDLGDDQPPGGLIGFTEDGDLLSPGPSGLLSWDMDTNESETIVEGRFGAGVVSSDRARLLLSETGSERGALTYLGRAILLDLRTGSATRLASHGDRITAIAMDAGGTIAVTGDVDGVIRVGPVTGEEPHLLLGKPDEILAVAVDPRGRWIASASGTEVRLWPMPDLAKPPLHTLPHDELIAKLKTLTNLRVVRDEGSATGWKLTVGPFPGWETVPTW